ncbi:pilus assembly protein PilM [Actinobacillus vicugnae]|uniref:pilus assembly protein PilM n=1 Tax=Actinobacillus vicugnae TaxID=2573093 RepID=UPI0012412C57|nr:pilus assembly protein PilM [Actinobacillus vicugnae]
MKSFAKLLKKSQKPYLVGMSENQHYRCFVVANKQTNSPEAYWQPKEVQSEFSLPQAVEFPANFTLVRTIPFQYIWRKYLFLPISYHQDFIYRQILQVLRQELPLAIEDVNFDYQLFPLPNDGVVKIVVYALRKNYANSLLVSPNTILDCELYCFIRGFNTLFDSDLAQQQRIYALQDKTVQLTLKSIELGNDITQANCCITQLDLPDSIKDPFLYITALGASLWNGKESI